MHTELLLSVFNNDLMNQYEFCVPFCQVMKTCKKMGIKTVAVHSDVDSNAVSYHQCSSRTDPSWDYFCNVPSGCSQLSYCSTVQYV